MAGTSVSNKILAPVNQAGVKAPVTLRLKSGGAIFNAVVFGIRMQNMTMSVSYADAVSGETRTVLLSDIADVGT
jgi:hypothetical protein